MLKTNGLEKLSYAKLEQLRQRVDRLMVQKKGSERGSAVAKKRSLELGDPRRTGKGKAKGKGRVAIKYRDPNNPENTWTGRGRTPRWMVAALKRGRAKKEDFLI